MTTSQVLVSRYTELVEANQLERAFGYLSEDVILHSWLGVAEGRENVITFMRDNIRFSHHTRNFNRWKQVQHCLQPHITSNTTGKVFDANGYDADGYATFERDGSIASHAKFHVYSVPVKETIVVRNDSIILINLDKRL